MNVEDMTKDERNLLLYFEDCMVNQMGCVQPSRMNDIDFDIAKDWHDDKFISFVRCPFAFIEKDRRDRVGGSYTHLVLLSNDAWKIAHILREARGNRQFSSLVEKRNNGKLLIPAIEKALENLGQIFPATINKQEQLELFKADLMKKSHEPSTKEEIEHREKMIRELGTLTPEDLQKRITI
jgi:hypothetical protein